MYSSQQRPALLPLPQLLIPSAYPNTASNIPVTYTSPSLPPFPDEKTYGQLLAEQESIEARRQLDKDEHDRQRKERQLQHDKQREVEERRMREEKEKREAAAKQREDKKRQEKDKRRQERQERRERRLKEEKDKLKRKHTPRPGHEEPLKEESKQQLSTDDRWIELVREMSGSKEQREEKKRRAAEKRVSLWSKRDDQVADGAVEAVTESDTDSLGSMGGPPLQLRDIASSSSSDALSSRSRSAKRDDREAMWSQSTRGTAVPLSPVRHRRRRHEAFAPPHSNSAVFADDRAYDGRSHSAEPNLLWSQPTPPRTPRASYQRTSDSLWSTPPPQLQLHSRPRATYYTPQPMQRSPPVYDAPLHARLLELPDTLLHPPAAHSVARPHFVPLRSSGTAIELSSEEEAEEEEELVLPMDEQLPRPRGRANVGRGGEVRQRWVNLLDEERLAVFSGLENDSRVSSALELPQQRPTHQPPVPASHRPHLSQPARQMSENANEAAGGGAEDGELQDDELLQRARELNYHALLLKKKRATQTPVFSSLSNAPDSNGRQLAVSPAVEQKVEAEMAKLRNRLNQQQQQQQQQPRSTAHTTATTPQPAQTTPHLPSRPLSPAAPLRDERPRARSLEQQRLSDKLAAIEQRLAESPPPPIRRVSSVSGEDEERRRRQQMEHRRQRQEDEARDLTHRLHTILLSPPSAASTPRTVTPPPTIPLVSVHPALKPVPLPPQARDKLTLLKGKQQQGKGKAASERGGGKSGMGLEEEELYDEAQALIVAFRSEFGGALKAHTENL